MDFNNLSEVAFKVLSKHGWSPQRDVSDMLCFPEEKKLVPGFEDIAKSFAFLEINFEVRSGRETLHFDLDESDESKNMRARTFSYSSKGDPKWLEDPDYMETEDYTLTTANEELIGSECSRIGFLDEELGAELYLVSTGEIYVSHWQNPILWGSCFVEFLNRVIVNE